MTMLMTAKKVYVYVVVGSGRHLTIAEGRVIVVLCDVISKPDVVIIDVKSHGGDIGAELSHFLQFYGNVVVGLPRQRLYALHNRK